MSGDGRIEYHWFKDNLIAIKWPLVLDDLEMQGGMQSVDQGDQDFSCDSKFIIGIIYDIVNSTRSNFCSIKVVNKESIYLAMYNAVGYSKNESVL